jgi:AcrR family transcriptional regulator
MSPRPRTTSDEQIMTATMRAMSRLGPVRLTLAAVAKEAGVSAATLVQRFGSKRALLLTLCRAAADSGDACFVQVRAAHPGSPLTALMAAATEMARMTRTPEEMSNHLAFLQIDLSDPDFYRYLLEMSRKTLIGYDALLREAVAAGELRRCDTARLARAINAIVGGSMIGWAVFRKGRADRWVRRDVETLLDPYRLPNAR